MSSMLSSKQKRIVALFSGIFSASIILLGFVLHEQWQAPTLKVSFLDVGQGDGILIRTPTGETIIIDGGPDSTIVSKLGRNLPFYDHTIDLMVLTHPHADHIAGLVELLARYDVERVLYTGVEYSSSYYREWLHRVDAEGAAVELANLGDHYVFGEVSFDVLYPLDVIQGEPFTDVNDSSIVLRVNYRQTAFLLAGDAPVSVEGEILSNASHTLLDVDVLKVGHHGSTSSTSQDFLEAVSPTYAIIQSGQGNKYGHPHQETLDRLHKFGATILRNDELGDIVCRSNGEQVQCE